MTISFPNIKPIIGFLFSLGLLIAIAFFFWDFIIGVHQNLDTISIILGSIFGVLSSLLLVLMIYRFKLIIINKEFIRQIHPFRLKSITIEHSNITNIKWDIWDAHKIGVYRKLLINRHDQQITLSDLEFSNFDSIQEQLLSLTHLDLDLNQKKTVEISQAKTNTWINYFALPFLLFFIVIGLADINFENPNLIRLLFTILPAIIVWRLIHKIVLYKQWTNQHDAARKRRLKKSIISTKRHG